MNQPKTELTNGQKFENIVYYFASWVYLFGAIYWYIGLALHHWRLGRWPTPPVVIETFGTSPTDAQSLLTVYGIHSAFGSLQWKVIDGVVGLRFRLLVSQAAFDYADCILDAHQGDTFVILSGAGKKRGQQLRRPFAQRSPGQSARPKARTGSAAKLRGWM